MTPTKAEALAARLESGWCPIESPADMERAAAELRRLSAVEAERDELKLAFAHAVRLVQDWKQSVYTTEAERDALLAAYARAALAARPAVPAGFVLVPVEPTLEMLTAAGREDDKAFIDGMPHGATAADTWAAMLAAAPTPPAPDCED